MANANRLNLVLGAALVLAVGAAYWLGRSPDEAPGGLPPGPASAPAGSELAAALPAANADPAATPAAPAAPPSPLLQAAGEAIQAEKWEEARKILEGIPPEDPAYSSALYNLGILYDRMALTDKALAVLDRLTRLQPDNPDAWVSLGWARWRSGDPALAEQATLRALEYEPNSPTARYNLGLFRLALERADEAISSYERAFRIDSKQLGYASALRDLRQYADTHPERADTHFALAFFYKVIGEYGLETKSLELFLASAPQGPRFEAATRRIEEATLKAREAGLLVPAVSPAAASPAPASTPGSGVNR